MKRSELIVDSFAGGGGASLGIAWALGRAPDIAINHNADALAMHAKNHPDTKHVLEDVWRADLRKLVGRRRVGLLWASPDCRHFSRAKGGKPVSKSVRSLAWIVTKWAAQVRPQIIMLENVREFADWGPLVPKWHCRECGWTGTEGQATLVRVRRRCPRCESLRLAVVKVVDKKTGETFDACMPDPDRKGLTFRRWLGRLRNLGYEVGYKTLDAADFGAPTHRKRLFLVARRDGKPIEWPEPTHGNPKKLDDTPLFSALKPWRTAAECIDWSIPCPSIFERKQPLKPATMRRIAMGIKRYVLENPKPFIIRYNSEKTPNDLRAQSLDEPFSTLDTQPRFALTMPHLMPITHSGDRKGHPLTEPMPTITTANRGEVALISPTLIQTGYGERDGQAPRVPGLDKPLGTVVNGGKHALVAAFLAKHFGGVVGHGVERPIGTVTAWDHHSLVAANLIHLNQGEKQWSACNEAMRTVTTGNHAGLVYSFLVKYFGQSLAANVLDPMPTVTVKDRFGLVTVTVDGELYVIVDIGMRMLTPRELARAQGFPDTYILWPKSKTKQTAFIGNSVSPYAAAAMARANCQAFAGVA